MKLVSQPIVKDVNPDLFEILDNLQSLGSNVCGGYARWLASPNAAKAGDIDLYPLDDQAWDESLTFLQQISTRTTIRKTNGQYPNVGEVHTFQVKTSWRHEPRYVLQLIRPNDFSIHTLDTFDFTVVQATLDTENKQILTVPEWRAHEMDRILVLRNLNYSSSGAAIFRLAKYLAKGYLISDSNLFKMYFSVPNRVDFFNYLQTIVLEKFKCEVKDKYPLFVNLVNLHKLDQPEPPPNDIPF